MDEKEKEQFPNVKSVCLKKKACCFDSSTWSSRELVKEGRQGSTSAYRRIRIAFARAASSIPAVFGAKGPPKTVAVFQTSLFQVMGDFRSVTSYPIEVCLFCASTVLNIDFAREHRMCSLRSVETRYPPSRDVGQETMPSLDPLPTGTRTITHNLAPASSGNGEAAYEPGIPQAGAIVVSVSCVSVPFAVDDIPSTCAAPRNTSCTRNTSTLSTG